MPTPLEDLIERVMGELHRMVRTETVVGDPVEAAGVTLIPVAKISFGFGAGGGGSEGKGQSGTGGGATVEPIAFLVITADGRVQLMTLKDKEAGLGQLVDLVPEVVERVKAFVGRRRQESDAHQAEA
jgi:uncharacterized spore protein YtfJ